MDNPDSFPGAPPSVAPSVPQAPLSGSLAAEAGAAVDNPLLHADEGVIDTPLLRHPHLPLLQARGSDAGDGDNTPRAAGGGAGVAADGAVGANASAAAMGA